MCFSKKPECAELLMLDKWRKRLDNKGSIGVILTELFRIFPVLSKFSIKTIPLLCIKEISILVPLNSMK